jgi:hypothetical protein
MNKKTLTCCYKDGKLVPFDIASPSAEFDFELVCKDYTERIWYNAKYPPAQMRYFDTSLRKRLLHRGCVCCDNIGNCECDVCKVDEEERYEELLRRGYNADTDRVHFDIPIRVYYWIMRGPIKINKFTDVQELLDQLNDGVDTLKQGRHIVNSHERDIVCGSKRVEEHDGSIGNVLIGDKEYLYKYIFTN